MKKNILTLTLFSVYTLLLHAQEQNLSLLLLTDSLMTNANAVVRYEYTNIELTSPSKMVIKEQVAVTILNKHGENNGVIYLHYDNFTKIKSVSARIYDAFGKEIKKIKKSDFIDQSAVDGSTLYGDSRLLSYEHHTSSYPYTITYEAEILTSHTAFIPIWSPVNNFQTSVVDSRFTLQYPTDITIRYKEFNLSPFHVEKDSGNGFLSYSVNNIKAIESESRSPAFYNIMPHVNFAANKFSLAGVDGEANNISELGKWINDKLLSNTGDLPQSTVNEVKALVKNEPDIVKRARIVYDYMQDKTRYISIQIGIGGWKPMQASEVDRLKYGDCKALTNYTSSLLKVAEVPSYYTVLFAKSRRDYDGELAAIQGNHAILMIPAQKDTIWLECTNQKFPFGHLGSFTDDRDALVITPDGGKIIHTKKYPVESNRQVIKGIVNINNSGGINADLTIESSGLQYDDHYRIAYFDDKEKDTYYKEYFNEINNLSLSHIEVRNNETEISFTENIRFSAENYAVNSGDKMLVRLNMVNTSEHIPKRVRNRKLPLEINYSFVDRDNVVINLPENYDLEAIGEPRSMKTKFGTYTLKIEKINEKQLKYIRELVVYQGLYSVADYESYRKFRKKISQLDHLKIVLTKS